jgi:hypothetical protein
VRFIEPDSHIIKKFVKNIFQRGPIYSVKILFSTVLCALLLTLNSCVIDSNAIVPKTVTIDGVKYRDGFYGNLWPNNLTYQDDLYEVKVWKFRRVDCDKFDWVHSAIGDTASGVLYCAENQWEQARGYYSNSDNFVFYCKIGAQYNDRDPVIEIIADIDFQKFNQLLDFADKNSYNPFGSNKNAKTRHLPIPDRDESPELVFYCESNDGFFTSYKGSKFHIMDGNLLLVFFYDYSHGEYEELVAVDVPDELGEYFIGLLARMTS